MGTALAKLDTEHLQTNRRLMVVRRAQAAAKLDELITGPRDEDIAAAGARVESLQAQVDRTRDGMIIRPIHRRRAERNRFRLVDAMADSSRWAT